MHGTSAFGAEKVTVTLSVAVSPSGAPVVLSIFTTGNGRSIAPMRYERPLAVVTTKAIGKADLSCRAFLRLRQQKALHH